MLSSEQTSSMMTRMSGTCSSPSSFCSFAALTECFCASVFFWRFAFSCAWFGFARLPLVALASLAPLRGGFAAPLLALLLELPLLRETFEFLTLRGQQLTHLPLDVAGVVDDGLLRNPIVGGSVELRRAAKDVHLPRVHLRVQIVNQLFQERGFSRSPRAVDDR